MIAGLSPACAKSSQIPGRRRQARDKAAIPALHRVVRSQPSKARALKTLLSVSIRVHWRFRIGSNIFARNLGVGRALL